ncbi:hypothetical protein EGH22_04875 [Halomicroarcula sp. F28]|uniref:hypothetical protein n=1 Tax=Haloarcula salinisoli TaxID=2487746 RepID=UPI001C730A96|nr:hypothetical protein [Halomicroarcula salinisoli]MBX0285647.1 hypothetical protein [Halomicroarcula salinisoli]
MRPKTLFSLGGGLQGGGGVATFAVLLASVAGGPTVETALVAGCLGSAVGLALARQPAEADIERYQGALVPVLTVFALPALSLVAVLAVHWWVPGGVAFYEGLTAAGLAILGALLQSHAAERQHVLALTAGPAVAVTLPGRYTQLRREHGSVLLVLGIGLALLYGYFAWFSRSLVSVAAGLGFLPLAYGVVRNSEAKVVPDGLVTGFRVMPWDRFEGYEIRDDAVVLHQCSALGRARLQFPLADIDDPRAVTYALSQYLRPKQTDW